MGLFDFLKSRKIHEPEQDFRKSVDNFINIDKLNFFGQSHQSENGRYILTWSDYDPNSRTSGFRKSGCGSYVLLEGGKIKLHGELERPNDGKVSNQGVFILNDWMFKDELKGTFYAFNAEGQKLIQYSYEANLLNNGLSNDGNFAVCQTANNPQGEDENKLFFFNLKERKLVWKRRPETGWAKGYRFDEAEGVIYLSYDKKNSYRYDFKGNFLDSEQWEKDCIDLANGYELLKIAEKKMEQLETVNADISHYDEVIDLLKRGIEKDVPGDWKALIHRKIGEIYCKCGENSKAIEHFEIAVKLNPGVGVKKLLKRMKTKNINFSE